MRMPALPIGLLVVCCAGEFLSSKSRLREALLQALPMRSRLMNEGFGYPSGAA